MQNTDVLMPRNNEEELLRLGYKLGFKELVLLYDALSKGLEKTTPLHSFEPPFQAHRPLKIKTLIIRRAGLVRSIGDIDKVKKKFDLLFAPAQRPFFENKKIKYLINAEESKAQDFLYQRRAGLDSVMCKLAKETSKVIVFNTRLLAPESKDKAEGVLNIVNNTVLARMMQNAKLCRKYKVKTLVATLATKPLEMRAPKDLQGFARTLKLV